MQDKLLMNLNERSVETTIDEQLKSLGWIDSIRSKNRNVYKHGEVKTKEQHAKLERTRPDYILYATGSIRPLAIIEVKSPHRNLDQALEQGYDYAKRLNAPVVFACNGVYIKTCHIKNGSPLVYNGAEVYTLLSEEQLNHFVDTPIHNHIQTRVAITRADLIRKFKRADDILKDEGLTKGVPRFDAFAQLLFLKLHSEEASSVLNGTIWSKDIAPLRSTALHKKIESLLVLLQERTAGNDVFTGILPIRTSTRLEAVIDLLDTIPLSNLELDIKGEAFEYFISAYNNGVKNDLGQYFTPRHIIKEMVKWLYPKLGETIYDPFCGTGGMLIECFKFIKRKGLSDTQLKILKHNTLYGRDITEEIARTAKMNMILFGDGYTNVQTGDSLASIDNEKGKYDIVITNMPFSQKTSSHSLYPIYPKGDKNGDSICIQHCLLALKDTPNARASIIVPIGFLYKDDFKAERQYICFNYCLDNIIDLRGGIFLPYTNQHTAILNIRHKVHQKATYNYYRIENDGYSLNAYRTKLHGNTDFDKIGNEAPDQVISLDTIKNKSLYSYKYLNIHTGARHVQLGDVASIQGGGASLSPNVTPDLFYGTENPFFMVEDIKGTNAYCYHARHHLTDMALRTYRLNKIPAGAILVPSSGIAILKNHRALLARDAYISTTIWAIIVDETKLNKYFLFYYLLNYEMLNLMYDCGYPGLKKSVLEALPLALPSKREIDVKTKLVQEIAELEKRTQALSARCFDL